MTSALNKLLFPGTSEEYRAARKIHISEIKKYRTQPQYILGFLLFFISTLVLLWILPGWQKVILFPLVFGEVCLRDCISEHYCLTIFRKGMQKDTNTVEQEAAAN